MIAGSEQLPLIEVGRIGVRSARPGVVRAPVGAACGVMGFLCFLPYPALGVGNATAVQMGNVAVLAMCLPAAFMAWRGRPFWVLPLLMGPLCVATAKAALAGQDGLDVCFKALAVWAVSLAAVLATQVAAPRHGASLLTGVAPAVILHAAVGLWQVYGFARGELPLVGVYVNPSFLSVQDNAETIGRYVQRPFGLFPEPSAMSSSLAPWVLLMFAVSCGAVRLRQRVLPWQRWLFLAASLAGLGLIIVSRSGHAAVTAVAFVGLVVSWLVRARATPRTVTALLAGVGVFLPVVLYLAAVSVGERLGGKSEFGNSSWGDRADSLRVGFAFFAESGVATQLLGMGVGQASPTLQASAGLDAVWSVLLTYVFETGLVGALALVVVGHLLARAWTTARYDLVFAAVAFVWLVGITLTTSYEQLLPLWMTLGLLTEWPAVCDTAGAARRGAVA